ncbi:CDP-diacylglycerol--inositol 3-phosphatidyltransferase-like [Diaphorina citri]|uniref:CDP-diacylglycerol--inositol 3-phosphatidyltransferase-like n=1 Tax=Diaphorina citri TaxID=121845 RepID=A0A1S3DC42_DIACI|nr:CDP-diacylglycerol--inositol 3-phosphatidyltransferase-like [Diaphorina citri]
MYIQVYNEDFAHDPVSYQICYGRIVLALISFYFMPTHYAIACWCYVISGLLDAIDGHAARYFNQSKDLFVELLLWGL